MKATPNKAHMAHVQPSRPPAERAAATAAAIAAVSAASRWMSVVAMCAPTTGKPSAKIAAAVRPSRSPHKRLPIESTDHVASTSASTPGRRAPQAFAPQSVIPAAMHQYASGGLVQCGRPSSVGSSQSPLASISRATSA